MPSLLPAEEMKSIALIAHNNMKPTLKRFVEHNRDMLKKFRITGTNTTIKMVKSIFGDEEGIVYGQACTSGPLGGDAQLAGQIASQEIGCVFFFVDPLSAHPHQADIDSLVRLINVHNIMFASNPSSAQALMQILKMGLDIQDIIPGMFHDAILTSPCVLQYQLGQQAVLEQNINAQASGSELALLDNSELGFFELRDWDHESCRRSRSSGSGSSTLSIRDESHSRA